MAQSIKCNIIHSEKSGTASLNIDGLDHGEDPLPWLYVISFRAVLEKGYTEAQMAEMRAEMIREFSMETTPLKGQA